eukprot:15325981-Heterocapsa_arctica.AAC.1
MTAGRSPTALQTEQHDIDNHVVYRDWCDVCVAARGQGTPRRRRKKMVEEGDGARIFSDFYFMSTDERSTPCLAVKFSRSKRI